MSVFDVVAAGAATQLRTLIASLAINASERLQPRWSPIDQAVALRIEHLRDSDSPRTAALYLHMYESSKRTKRTELSDEAVAEAFLELIDTLRPEAGTLQMDFDEDDEPQSSNVTPTRETVPQDDSADLVITEDSTPRPGIPTPEVNPITARRERHRGRIAGWSLAVYVLFLAAWVVLDVLGLPTDGVQGALVALGLLTTAISGFYFPGPSKDE